MSSELYTEQAMSFFCFWYVFIFCNYVYKIVLIFFQSTFYEM